MKQVTDPILIAAPTRCGTTMLAWLLHLHGVWIGEGNVTQAPETNPQVATENTEIKTYLRSVSGSPPDFRKRVLGMVGGDPWLVKSPQNLLKWQVWAEHFPNARWLFPLRSLDGIVASKMRHPGMAKRGEAANRETTRQHQRLQKAALGAVNGKPVLVDSLCRGGVVGEAQARGAVEFCGLTFEPALYRGWVQPERWTA